MKKRIYEIAFRFVLACTAGTALYAHAEDVSEIWNAKFQTTYVWQTKPAFQAPYTGAYSLIPEKEKAYSFSATASLGWRPWQGTELYLDPEIVQGVPFSGLTGLGGLTNGEQQKTSGPNPTLYRARLFLRQTWGMGGGTEPVESAANALAAAVDKRRVVLTAGNISVLDVFDVSSHAHDARMQFLNWALTTYGAYDFAADARGYTWGVAAEYIYDDWAFRVGRFIQPEESNGLALDRRILKHYGDQIEFEHDHTIDDRQGKLKLLVFHNRANMGSFRNALTDAAAYGGVPDVSRVRRDQGKFGLGVNAEQNVTPSVGIFTRVSWNDGKTETYAFSEIERSISVGATIHGQAWGREKDTFGIATVRNGLSSAHQDYLAQGGHGAFIGDGMLRYQPETLLEAYYSLNLARDLWLSGDIQHIVNPAYNADRGPVTVGSVRLHAEF